MMTILVFSLAMETISVIKSFKNICAVAVFSVNSLFQDVRNLENESNASYLAQFEQFEV